MATITLERSRGLPEVAVATMLLLYARMPERIIHGFLWAEDVKIFLAQAYQLGAKSIVTPYAGYIHLVPRVIAYLFSRLFHITAAPHVFVTACLLITAASGMWVFSISRRVLPEPAAMLMGLAPMLVPSTGEVWLSITNLQWILAPLLLALLWEEFWAHAAPSKGRMLAIIALSLTGPFAVFFAPFTLFSTIRKHRGFGYIVLPLVQITVTVWFGFKQQATGHPPSSYLDYPWISEAGRHLVFDFFLPQGIGHWEVAALACTAVGLLCVLSLRRHGYACWALIAFGAMLWASGIVRSGVWGDAYLAWFDGGSRFFFLPAVFFAWTLVIVAGLSTSSRARTGSSVMLILMLLVSYSAFRVAPYPETTFEKNESGWTIATPPGGPDWVTSFSRDAS